MLGFSKAYYLNCFRVGIFTLWSLLSLVPLKSQELIFNHLTKKDGLTESGYNSFVKKDSRGFVWISSLDGLNRYDGLKIKQYRSHRNKPNAMLGDRIQSTFYEDKRNNLWFATKQALNCYLRSKDSIKSIQFKNLAKGYHIFHQNYSENKLWLTIEDEVFTFDTENYVFQSMDIKTIGRRFTVDTLLDGTLDKVYACPWILEPGLELISIDDDCSDWRLTKYLINYEDSKGIRAPFISQAIKVNDSISWLCSDIGLILFNEDRPESAQYFYPDSLKRMNIRNMEMLKDGNLLISSYKEGLWFFNTKRFSFTKNWRTTKSNPFAPASNAPKELYEDYFGHIWVSHYQEGVDYSLNNYSNFHNPLAELALTNPRVEFILEDKFANIWVATKRQGIFVFDQNENLINSYTFSDIETEGLNFDEIRHLGLDLEGNVWCTSRHSIFRFDIKLERWENILVLPKRDLFFVLFLRSGRTLLTTNDGIFDLIEEKGVYKLNPAKDIEKYNEFNFLQSFESSNGLVFLPARHSDLLVYQQDYDHKFALKTKRVFGCEIYGITESSTSNNLWLGTSNGLASIDQQSFELNMMLQEGWQIGSRDVYAIIEDDNNSLWISSNDGLWSYNRELDELKQFTEIDGLPSREFTDLGFLKASSGRIWLGNNRGLTVFSPDSIQSYPNPPQPYIDGLLVNNVAYKGDTFIGEETSIELYYQDNNLAFELLAIGIFQPQRSRLRYRLKNYDTSWTIIKNGDFARFTKVPPGDYTLEVIAIGANGLESPTKQLKVKINPPFWNTVWFKTISFLVLFLFIWFLHRIYLRKKLREQEIVFERKRTQLLERERIRKELHDDLGAGLSTIQFQSEDLLWQNVNPDFQDHLKDIRNTASELMESMDEIVWALNPGNDTLENLVLDLRKYTYSFLLKHKLELQLIIPEEIPAIELRGEIRRNVKLIVKEALHNVVRHAQATEVIFKILLENQSLVVLVKDNGIGFAEERREGRKGNGLINMNQRAKAISGKLEKVSKIDKGTEIRLIAPIGAE